MRCPACGKRIQRDMELCGHCGFTLNASTDSGDGDQSGLPTYQDNIEVGSVKSRDIHYRSRIALFQAVKSGLRQYFNFHGRSSRTEYWWWIFCLPQAWWVSVVTDGLLLGDTGAFISLTFLVLITPSLAVSVRRLHDRNRSGWWLLLGPIPLVNLLLLVFYLQGGDSGSNRFGPNPRSPAT